MGDYLPPADPVVVDQCDVDVSADADELAYDRGVDLDVCLDVDLADRTREQRAVDAELGAVADLEVTDAGRDDGSGDGVLEVL